MIFMPFICLDYSIIKSSVTYTLSAKTDIATGLCSHINRVVSKTLLTN